MRVCEIAKEAGVTSAEVLRVAEKTGVEVSSAVSTVEDGELAALADRERILVGRRDAPHRVGHVGVDLDGLELRRG